MRTSEDTKLKEPQTDLRDRGKERTILFEDEVERKNSIKRTGSLSGILKKSHKFWSDTERDAFMEKHKHTVLPYTIASVSSDSYDKSPPKVKYVFKPTETQTNPHPIRIVPV